MKVNKVFIGVIAGFTLISNVYAANKTHLTDTLGAGNNKVDISFGVSGGSGTSSILSSGSTTSYDSKMTGHSLSVDYARGITDRLDITISAPLILNSNSTSEYVFGGSQYKTTSKTEGQGDLALGAQYLILDKQQNQVDWIVLGLYSPSTASSEDSTSETSINGSVTTPGKTGKPGRGYATTGIATALAIPSSVGDVVLTASYFSGGETTSGGVEYRAGDSKALGLYLESMISENTTLTPFIGYYMFGSYSYGTQDYSSTSAYSLGISLTHDVSKAFSIKVDTGYMRMPETSYTDDFTYSYKSYSLMLSTLFFF
ncbi:MAG: hypothetical protein Q7U91_12925 [Sideroxyarcus sp.]|nr:hypothetical protein [Sideroxyarcus sp.]